MKNLKFKTMAMIMGLLIALSGLALAAFANGEVDWGRGIVRATGNGVVPPNAINAAQARMLGRRAAQVDAYRQLAETIKGVQVTGETNVENFMTMSDLVNARVQATIQGARIVSERQTSDGGYEVVMEVPIYGINNSIASAVLERPQIVERFPQPTQPTQPTYSSASNGYTGLIIDCRGLNLNPVMSPVIKNDNGTKIYGYQNLDYDKVIRDGMASYTYSLGNAPRAGSNPLIIRAVRLEDHNANPVISAADANRVLAENNVSHFLEATNVVFVR